MDTQAIQWLLPFFGGLWAKLTLKHRYILLFSAFGLGLSGIFLLSTLGSDFKKKELNFS